MEFIDIPLQIITSKTERPCDASLSSEVQFIPNGERLTNLLNSTAEYLRLTTNSDGYILYFLDEGLQELYICPSAPTENGCVINRYRWSTDRDDTIAVCALKRKTWILVDTKTSVDLHFPYLQALPSLYPRYILSLPLANRNKFCFGVVEFYRNNGGQYNEVDIQKCQFLLQNCAEALKQNENAIFFTKYNEIQFKLQHLLEMYASGDDDDWSYNFLNQVVSLARDNTQAKSSSVFLEKQGELLKIASTDKDHYFRQGNYEQREHGSIMRTVASADFQVTLMNRKIQGVINVCNKKYLSQFSRLDKQILEAFAKMCTLWCVIEYTSSCVKKQKSLNENIMSLINSQLQNARDVGKRLRVSIPSDLSVLNSWYYSLPESFEREKLSSELVDMISRVKGQTPVADQALRDFIVMVEHCHRNGEEYDYRHTVLSVQCLYQLLQSCKSVATEHESLAMIIASLCNNIAVKNSPTAKPSIFGRYNLYAKELIRFEIVHFLIQETELLSQLNTDDRNLVLHMIKEFIIDMSLSRFKHNTLRFCELTQNGDLRKLEMQNDIEFRSLIQSILPGVGNILGHFKSQIFLENFPNFPVFQYLEENNLKCIDIILAICPT